jgi:hypothetical protein
MTDVCEGLRSHGEAVAALLTGRPSLDASPMLMTRVGLPWMAVSLEWIVLGLVLIVLVTAWIFRSRAPAVTIGLLGSIVGGFVGFLAGASNGPRNAPAAAAVGATASLVVVGVVGLLATRRRATTRVLHRAAICVVAGGLVCTGILTLALLDACPLYITYAGYCSYGGVDVLGGWVSGVVALFGFDAIVVAGLLLASGRERLE